MATPIARPMTVPPPYPGDSIEASGSAGNNFRPTADLELDFKRILHGIAVLLEKYKSSQKDLSSDQKVFLEKYALDNTGDDLLSTDSGWSVAYLTIKKEILLCFEVFKKQVGLQMTTDEFLLEELLSKSGLSKDQLEYVLAELLGVAVSHIAINKITVSDIIIPNELSQPYESYINFLNGQIDGNYCRNFIADSVLTLIYFYREFNRDFSKVFILPNFINWVKSKKEVLPLINQIELSKQLYELNKKTILKLISTCPESGFQVNKDFVLDVNINNFKEFLKKSNIQTSSRLFLRILLQDEKTKEEILSGIDKLVPSKGLELDSFCWLIFYKSVDNQINYEFEEYLTSVKEGKRNLENELYGKIKEQVYQRFVRDLREESDCAKIEDIGRQLKVMINNNHSQESPTSSL